jgi:hypothetical protein
MNRKSIEATGGTQQKYTSPFLQSLMNNQHNFGSNLNFNQTTPENPATKTK